MSERIEKIRARCEAATPSPWYMTRWHNDGYYIDNRNTVAQKPVAIVNRNSDAIFIAHARYDIPLLLNLLAERDAEIKRLRIAAGETEEIN